MKLIRKYYEDGKKKEEYYINAEGNKEGKYSLWYIDGQRYNEKNYKNGLLEGKYEYWHSNGQKGAEKNYKNGVLEGKREVWHLNGQKETESNCRNGKLEGEYKYWNKKGILREYIYHYSIKEIIIKNKIYGYTILKALINKKKHQRITLQMNEIRTHISELEPLIYNCIIGYLTEPEKIEIIRTNKKRELMYKSG